MWLNGRTQPRHFLPNKLNNQKYSVLSFCFVVLFNEFKWVRKGLDLPTTTAATGALDAVEPIAGDGARGSEDGDNLAPA